MVARLKEFYTKTVVPEIISKNGLKNAHQVPRLDKIVLNVGVGEAKDNANLLKSYVEEMALIAGQKPVVTKAKKSIANFKVRQDQAVGIKVTLRGTKMYEFYDRFVNVALARVKDFKGVSMKSFDKFGNYSLGIKEQFIFPEINFDKIQKIHGMDVIFAMKSDDSELSRQVLELMGMPFRKTK